MGTKFKSNVGTQPNAAGLQQIAPGSNRIPQSFLNGIGRTVDRATLRFGGNNIFQQLAGGTVITPLDQTGTPPGVGYLHPFKVSFAGKPSTGSKVFVTIAEGHIIGRVNFADGAWSQLSTYLEAPADYEQGSIGIPGVDLTWEGGWPGGPAPDTSAGDNATDPANQSTGATETSGATYHSSTAQGNNGYVSGNAGSVTKPGQGNSGTYHSKPPVTGNGTYVSGNAGSVTNPNQGKSGTYHTKPGVTGNGSYVGGNKGSITNGGNSSAVYNPPLKQT